jgi:signal transduction histidine kinase/DNA-binding response OmpR family regulator/ligand-binding sensor domain-containing protein
VKKNIRNCDRLYPIHITPKINWIIIGLFQFFLFYKASNAQHSYTPELVDPLTEPWRWKDFPELVGKGVRNIAETNDGAVWFGIDKGIIKYDGKTWQTFNHDNGFVSIPINQLCVEKGQTVYAGTDSGLYQLSNNRWKRIFPTIWHASQTKFYKVYCVRVLPSGGIIASVGMNMYGGLLVIRNNRTAFFSSKRAIERLKGKYPGMDLKTIPENITFSEKFNVEELFIDRQEQIWAATKNQTSIGHILKLKLHSKEFDSIIVSKIFTDKDGLKQGKQTQFGQLRNGNIWTINGAYNIGISNYNGNQWNYFRLSDKLGEDDLHTAILETHDGTLWIGGFGVLYALKGGNWTIYRKPSAAVPNTRTLLFEDSKGYLWVIGKQNEVFQIDYASQTWSTYKHLNFQCQDKTGKKWFISVDGHVIVNENNKWYAYGTTDGLPDAPVRVYATSKNQLWVTGSHKGNAATAFFNGYKWEMQVYPTLSWGIDYRAVFEDKEGSLWFGGCVNFNPKTGQIGGILKIERPLEKNAHCIQYNPDDISQVFSAYGIAQSKDGKIWIGGSHLVSFDGKTWESTLKPETIVNYQDVLVNKPNGMLYIASRNYGIYQYDGKNWAHFNVENGLTSNAVISILPITNNNILVATDMDICRYDGQSWTSHIFPGQMTLTREGGDLKIGSTGKLWINKSLREWKRRALKNNKINKEVFDNFQTISYKSDTMPPYTTIKEYSKKVSRNGNTVISWTGSDYWKVTPTNRLSYSYRINSGKWSNFSEKTYETFLNLKSGKYAFEVRARDLDLNVDPTPAKIEFEVQPPIWKEVWFLFLIFIFLTIIAIYEYKAIKHSRHLARLNKSLLLTKNQVEEQKEQILEQHKRERENNQMKMRFFTNISHEFRTPLTLILGSVDKIKDANKKNDQLTMKRYIQTLQNNSQQLLRLINQLMDFRKLETESMNLKVSKVNIIRYIQNICTNFNNLASQYQISILFESNVNALLVWFDADKIEKIMYNLISNALKFTPINGIIKVSVVVEDSSVWEQAFYYITVQDTGLGIPEDEIEKIFDPFYQSRVQQVRKYEGTGIGLSLVKSMVQLHHGELKVKSLLKQNTSSDDFSTCFTIKLPLDETLYKPDEFSSGEINETSLSEKLSIIEIKENERAIKDYLQNEIELTDDRQKQIILIVEDNEDLQALMFESLEEYYSILLAKNGNEGFENAVTYTPDLIISDIMMPVMSGTEMCLKIKDDPRTSHIPVILLTARTSEEHRIEGYESGADDYISKPFNMVVLNARIKNLIEIRKALRMTFRKEIYSKSIDALAKPIDANFLDKVIEIIEKNMENSAFDVEALSKEVGLSSRHLLNKLQNLTDHTPVELIRTLRLKRAEKLLLTKNYTIAEIAYDVGFSDPNYFSKCFVKQYGKTPKEYMESKQSVE